MTGTARTGVVAAPRPGPDAAMPIAIWTVIAAAAACISLSLGVRQSFGLFLLPLSTEHAISPAWIGAALAIGNLVWGLGQPFSGAMGDKYGAGRVAAVGGLLIAAGLLVTALVPGPLAPVLGLGLLVGLGIGCAGTGPVLSAVGRAVPPARRGEMIGLAAAGGSLGQAAMVPIGQSLIETWGASAALVALAATMLLIIPVARNVEWATPKLAPGAQRGAGLAGLPGLARMAMRDRDFALLTAGFFACGFQLAFITVHLPAYLVLCGLAPGLGATALMTVGLFNIPGSWLCGKLSSVVRPELALGFIYLIRTLAILAFVTATPTATGAVLFAAVMGFVWLGSIPLTNAAIAQRFGVANLGALYGVCFVSHQVGGFLGAGTGAVLYETTGGYDGFWTVLIGVGLSASLFNWVIRPATLRALPA
jgi:MFS family permease